MAILPVRRGESGKLTVNVFPIALQSAPTYIPGVSDLKDVSWTGTGSVSALSGGTAELAVFDLSTGEK